MPMEVANAVSECKIDETQRVCFDWGREFELPEVQATARSGVADNVRPPTNTVVPAEASAG